MPASSSGIRDVLQFSNEATTQPAEQGEVVLSQSDTESSSDSTASDEVDARAQNILEMAESMKPNAANHNDAEREGVLFKHKKLGTFHLLKRGDLNVLGCGRPITNFEKCERWPFLVVPRCKVCFANVDLSFDDEAN